MSEPSIQDVVTRLDDLLKEVRRQGRAAIAAQAAAESCLEALQEPAEADPARDAAAAEEAARWARALIPVADAVDRIVERAEAPRPLPKRSFVERLASVAGAGPDLGEAGARAALAEGLRVLHAQLGGVLRDMGVEVDRRTGGPVDGERQRVVEVRPPRAGEAPGVVVAVLRPGYALGARVLREAEVVVTGGGAR